MGSLTWPKIILIFWPFLTACVIAAKPIFTTDAQKQKLNKLISTVNVSYQEKSMTIKNEALKNKKDNFIKRENDKLQKLGINFRFEGLCSIALVLFVVAALVSMFLFKAGPLLMIYLGGLAGYCVFIYVDSVLEKRKKELTLEFLQKMRDVASYLSSGQSLDNALKEASSSGNISLVMKRELGQIRQDIFTHTKYSEAFMNMYKRLEIDEIRTYAETLSAFEETGGNLLTVMKVNDRFAAEKIEVKNKQNIFAEGQKTSQKVIVGVPLTMLIVMFIANPSFFGDFYSTFLGQIVAIISVTILVVGVKMSSKLAKAV